MDIDMVEIHQEFLVSLLLKNRVGILVHNRITNYRYRFKKNKQKLKMNTKQRKQTSVMKLMNMVHHDCEESFSTICITDAIQPRHHPV